VCTAGAPTGALIVQNGINSNFFNAFNNYTINWGDGSPAFTTTADTWAAPNPAATHEYSVGNYTLTFTASTSNCSVSNQYNVYVGNTPSVSMGSPGGTQGCSEVTVAFPISNASANIPTTTYTVTFSDGSQSISFNQPPPASVTHEFNNSSCGQTFQNLANSYGVTMVATNECGTAQVTVAPVTISDPPQANFTSSVETICLGGVVNFDDTSNPGTTATSTSCESNAEFYWTITPASGWSVASGTLGSNNGLPNNFTVWTPGSDILGVNFLSPGTYTTTLNYRNGCGPSAHTETICVINPPTCDFDVNNNSGCGPLSVVTDNNTVAPQCGNTNINLNYNWSVVVPTGGSYALTSGTLTSNSPNFNLTNTTTAPLVYTINLAVTPINPQTGAAMSNCSSTCSETITVYPAPVITTNPTPTQTICVGGTPGSLNVAYAYGVGTPSYQWYSNTVNSNTGGTLINGATNATYAPPIQNNAGTFYYYAVITLGGTCGTISSNPACVLVVPDPTISTQPTTTQTICSGGSPSAVQFAYSNGTGSAAYQWFSNTTSATTGGTLIPGATNASFTPSVPSTAGTYYFYGTLNLNGIGCNPATSAITQVIVVNDPAVTVTPTEITVCQNAVAQQITASVSGGNGTSAYQWFQSSTNTNSGGTPITGQTSSTFTPSTTTVGSQYYYAQVTQSTSGCAGVSPVVTVNVLPAASINVQPVASTVCVGGVANILSVGYINGIGTPAYQWYSSSNINGSNPVVISGATSASYTPPTSTVGTIYYYVSISFPTGGCSNISSTPIPVTIIADPTITIQPNTQQDVCVGGAASSPFTSVVQGGTGTLSYQWYSNNTSSNTNGQIINGATAAGYTSPVLNTVGTIYYYATITASGSGCGISPSNVVSINVVNDPTITTQAISNQTVCQNTPTSALSVVTNGGVGTSNIVWYSNGTNSTTGGTQVSTSANYTPPSTSVGTIYYYAIINQTGSGCSVTSAVSSVTVTPTPTITQQPIPSTVCVGGVPNTLAVTFINGLGTPSYQWFSSSNSNGSNPTTISGATAATYVPPTSTAGTTYYYVTISFQNGACSNISSTPTLVTVVADLSVSTQPNSPFTICQGTTLTNPISIVAQGGTGTITYQWYSNTSASTTGGTAIPTATLASYNPGVVNTPGTYYYYAIVSASGNGCENTTSNVASLTVNPQANATVLGPFTSCGTAAVPISATSSGAGTWSAPPGSGSFSSTTNLTSSFTPVASGSQNIVLTWTTTDPDGSGPCPAVSDTDILTVYPPATASINPITSVCTNTTLALVATSNSPGTWTTNGSGTFSSTTTLSTVYTPNTNDASTSPLTFTWTTQDPDGSGPCVSVSAVQNVSVFNPPIVNAGPDQVLCLNSPSVNLAGTPSAGTWTGTGVSSVGSFNPNSIGTFNLTYTFTDNNGCSTQDNLIINVNQSAIADAGGPYATCGVTPVNISSTTNGNGVWTGGVGVFANATNASTTYTPAASEVGTDITLQWETIDPDGTGPCSNAIDNVILEINTPATAVPGGPYTICSSDNANISVTTTPGGGSWSQGSGSFGVVSSANTTYDPSNAEAGSTVNLLWTTIDPDQGGPCQAVTATVIVNVLEAAIADANGPYATCGITPVNISATTNGNGIWTGGIGVFANATNASTTYTPAASEVGTDITLQWETIDPDGIGPCSNAIDNATLEINTPATAIPGGPYTICSSDNASISVTTTPGAGSWSQGSGTFGSVTSANTSYDPSTSEGGSAVNLIWTTIDPDQAGPCPAVTATVIVNVLEAAIADANGPYATCGITPVNISATTNGNGIWTGGIGVFANATNAATTYTPAASEVGTDITLQWETIDPDGTGPCSNAVDNTTITISTPATANPGGPYTICSNGSAEISVITTPGDGSWTGGLGTFESSTSSVTDYTPSSSEGGSTVELTWTTEDPDDSGPCPSVIVNVDVIILEEATAEILGPLVTCANETFELTSLSNGPGEWSYSPLSNGNILDVSSNITTFEPSVDFYSDEEVSVTWTTFDPDGNGPCTAFSVTEILNIESLPVIDLDATFQIDCGDDIFATVSAGSGGFTYQWTPTVGVISSNTATTPINASGVYTITASDSNGCNNDASTTVSINALDQMAQADDVETCLFEEVQIFGEATIGEAPFTYTWTPNTLIIPAQGNTATISFEYNGALVQDSIFTLNLNISDAFGCSDNEEVEVTVHPLPVVDAGLDLAFCEDEPVVNITNFSPAPNSGTSSYWTPSNSINPGNLAIGNTTFTYSFTDLNGCVNDDDLIVTIHEVPISDFNYPLSACEGEVVTFTNSSQCGTCGPLEYLWEVEASGFSSTSNNLQYTFQDTGFVNVSLLVQSSFGCSSFITQTIHILALPETSFELSEHVGCGPINIVVDNTSIGSETDYAWNIEPFGASTLSEPGELIFPSAPCDSIFYNISLTTTNICGSTTFNDSLLVYSLPQPLFSPTADTVCSEIPLEIYNTTQCAWQTSYSWDLGDGIYSDSQELVFEHVYFAENDFQSYPLTLIATNPCGVVENTQVITAVPNEITAFFNADPLIGCEPLLVNFDQEMFGVTYFAWDYGDGGTSLIEDPQYVFENDGVFEVTFLAGNFCGAQDTATQIIEVLPAPNFNFTSSEQFLCVGEATTFEPFGDPITGYNWNFGDTETSTLISPTHIYNAEGDFEVSLTGISTVNGCPNTVTNTITVITTPVALIIADDLAGCAPFQAVFNNETINAVNYYWNLGDGNFYIGDTLVHTFQNEGTYDVEIVAVNDNSCTDTTNVTITVYPQPTAAFELTTYDTEFMFDVDFDNYSTDAVAYEWILGDGATTYLTEVYYSYAKTGDCAYFPTLVAYNEFGCTDSATKPVLIPFDMEIFAPNSFTPNGDNLNDEFIIFTTDVEPSYSHLQIIDRWGVVVHEDFGINPSWNGYITNKPAPNDVYQYIYRARLKCGIEDYQKVGHVTIIR
jgi:gliding motility-associated-like protein